MTAELAAVAGGAAHAGVRAPRQQPASVNQENQQPNVQVPKVGDVQMGSSPERKVNEQMQAS